MSYEGMLQMVVDGPGAADALAECYEKVYADLKEKADEGRFDGRLNSCSFVTRNGDDTGVLQDGSWSYDPGALKRGEVGTQLSAMVYDLVPKGLFVDVMFVGDDVAHAMSLHADAEGVRARFGLDAVRGCCL